MTAQLVVVEEPRAEDRKAVSVPLAEHNGRNGPPVDAQPLAILLRDENGAAVGGLWGRTAYDWLFVELLAVPEIMRGQNHGVAMMAKAEAIAKERGCVGAWLDTYAFQARGFYEKLGYSVFGTIEDHPIGSARYFLSKRF